jgi:hypothetical protein
MFRKLVLIAVPLVLAGGVAIVMRGLAQSTRATPQSTHLPPARTSSANSRALHFRASRAWVSKYWWIPPGAQLLNELLAHHSYPSMAWP